jgi:hypothetical protein
MTSRRKEIDIPGTTTELFSIDLKKTSAGNNIFNGTAFVIVPFNHRRPGIRNPPTAVQETKKNTIFIKNAHPCCTFLHLFHSKISKILSFGKNTSLFHKSQIHRYLFIRYSICPAVSAN